MTKRNAPRDWQRVVFAAELVHVPGCDREGCDCAECPVCGGDYGECPCPGPTMEGWAYRVDADGTLWARRQRARLHNRPNDS